MVIYLTFRNRSSFPKSRAAATISILRVEPPQKMLYKFLESEPLVEIYRRRLAGNAIEDDSFNLTPVIRIYDEQGATTDLRSGLMAAEMPLAGDLRAFAPSCSLCPKSLSVIISEKMSRPGSELNRPERCLQRPQRVCSPRGARLPEPAIELVSQTAHHSAAN